MVFGSNMDQYFHDFSVCFCITIPTSFLYDFGEFVFEPEKDMLLKSLLPRYIETIVFRAMMDSVASEQGSRMTAMDSATNNASEMISSLTLQYNRARQAAITRELVEITTGAQAISG